MNENGKMEMKMEMGPVETVASKEEWALMGKSQCTKTYNMGKITPRNALPRQKEWARPDEGQLATSGYGIFDDITELRKFIDFFERENAEYIAQLTSEYVVKKRGKIKTARIVGGL